MTALSRSRLLCIVAPRWLSRLPRLATLALLAWASGGRLGAAEDPGGDPGGLGRGVPSTAFLYARWQLQEGGWLAKRLRGVADAASESGFVGEVCSRWLSASAGPLQGRGPEGAKDDETRVLEARLALGRRILGAIDLWALLGQEVVLAGVAEEGLPEILLGFRVPGRERERIVARLEKILFGLSSLDPRMELTLSSSESEHVDVLYDLDRPWELCLAASGDAILVSTSSQLLRRSLRLLAGEGSELGYPYAAERKEALESISFSPRSLRGECFELHVRPARLVPERPILLGLESIVAAGKVVGGSLTFGYQARFGPPGTVGADLLRRVFLERPSVRPWLSSLPEGLGSFEVSSGWSPDGLGEALDALVGEFIPWGRQPLKDLWARGMAAFFPRWRDLVGCLTGRRMLLSSPEGFALLLELKDPPEGRRQLRQICDQLADDCPFFRPEETPAGDLGSVLEVPGLDAHLRWFSLPFLEGRRLLLGAAGDFAVLASAPAPVQLYFSPPSRSPAGSGPADEVLKPLYLAGGEILRVVRMEPPLAAVAWPLALSAASGLPGVLGDARLGDASKALLESLPRLARAAKELSFLWGGTVCSIRSGDRLRGFGEVLLDRKSGNDVQRSF